MKTRKKQKTRLRQLRKKKSKIQVVDAGYSPLFHTESSAWNRGLCFDEMTVGGVYEKGTDL